MCNMDCFNCALPDCRNDHVTDTERKAQDAYDKESVKERGERMRKGQKTAQYDYEHSDKGKETRRQYRQTPQYKAQQKAYRQTETYKAKMRRHQQTEKGKAAAKRARQKQIASGKNAEYCRAYYQRKKEEALRGLFSEINTTN